MAKAKRSRKVECVLAWVSAFDPKTRMAMVAIDGETLSEDGAGILYACSMRCYIVPERIGVRLGLVPLTIKPAKKSPPTKSRR